MQTALVRELNWGFGFEQPRKVVERINEFNTAQKGREGEGNIGIDFYDIAQFFTFVSQDELKQ